MGAAPVSSTPLATESYVDIPRYMGRWYEIARYPAPFENNCVAVYATYGLRSDGRVDVANRCLKGSMQGPESVARGIARVVDTQTNAKLKVSFFWPFEGDYWILELGTDYDYVVVGEPGRKYLWIMSRTPHMDAALYGDILSRLATKGYDAARLTLTPQP